MDSNFKAISSFDPKHWDSDPLFLDSLCTKGRYSAPTSERSSDFQEVTWDRVVGSAEGVFEAPTGDLGVHYKVVPDGIVSHHYDVDFLFFKRNSSKLLVIFHGALLREKYSLPRFEFMNTFLNYEGSVLFISDPTLYKHQELPLGWYVGDEVDNLHEILAKLINSAAKNLSAKKVVLTGSSGGGFASLATSIRVPKSVALAFSPQAAIERYYRTHRAKFAAVSFKNASRTKSGLLEHACRLDLGALYASLPGSNKVLYVQNTGDDFHMINHCVPFAKSLGLDFSKNKFCDDRFIFDLVKYRDGHGAPNPRTMLFYVRKAFDLC